MYAEENQEHCMKFVCYIVSYWIAAAVTYSARIQDAPSLGYPSHKIKDSLLPYTAHIHYSIFFVTTPMKSVISIN